jgi:hypothetical protein
MEFYWDVPRMLTGAWRDSCCGTNGNLAEYHATDDRFDEDWLAEGTRVVVVAGFGMRRFQG